MRVNKSLIIAIFCLIGFCAIAVLFRVFPIFDLPASFVGAALGAVITGVVTTILLEGQSRVEEVKERNVAVFKEKSTIFKKFIGTIWTAWQDHSISENEYFDLTRMFYQELMLYLKPESQKDIGGALKEIGSFIDQDANENQAVEEQLRKNIVIIINGLILELDLGGEIDEKLFKELDETIKKCRNRKQNRTFKTLGIKIGTELVFKRDTSISCKTVDDKNRVKYGDQELTISGLASELVGGSANGFAEFMLNGKIILEIDKNT